MPNLQADFEYLLQNSTSDNPKILPALVQAYGDYANRLVYGLFIEEARETVLAAVLLKVYRSLDQYPIGSDFRRWFTKVALRVCKTYGQKRQRLTLKWPPSDLEPTEPAADPDINSWPILVIPKRKYFLPILLKYSLNLTLEEVSQILHLREKAVVDRIDQGLQGLWLQANPGGPELSGAPGKEKVHHEVRRQTLHDGGSTTPESEANYQAHLATCSHCRSYKEFADQLASHLPYVLGPPPFSSETLLNNLMLQLDQRNGIQRQPLQLRRPGQEVFWVVMGVGLVLGIGWFFNRINPLTEVQQALEAQVTPTLVAPLEPFSGEAHRVPSPAESNIQSGTSSESSWNPMISGQGDQVVFASTIRHLGESDTNGASDIFLYEMGNGTIERISISSTGAEANNGSYEPSISGDSRYVVFTSWANNLARQDKLNCKFWNTQSSCTDIFLRDRKFGTTNLISRSPGGAPGDNISFRPEISQNGNLIAFWSAASDLVPDDTDTCGSNTQAHNCVDLFLYDLSEDKIDRIPIGRNFTEELPRHYEVSLSADGEFLIVTLDATDRIAVDLGMKNPLDTYLYQRSTGQFEPVNLAADGTLGNGPSFAGQISPDGRWIVWASLADNLTVSDTNEYVDVYLRDRLSGSVTRVSTSFGGGELDGDSGIIGDQENWFSDSMSISEDGEYILYSSTATNLVPDQKNYCGIAPGCRNVYLFSRLTGDTTQLNQSNIDFIPFVSIAADGASGTFMAQSKTCNRLDFCVDIFVFNRTEGLVTQLGSYRGRSESDPPVSPTLADKITLKSHSRWVVGLAFSPDGRYLASGSRDQSVVVWSLKEEQQIATLDGELLAYSPTGDLLATADDDQMIYLWRMPQGQLMGVLRNEVRARDLAFTPDGGTLAVAGSKAVYLWQIEDRTMIKKISIPARVVRAISISPDGKFLAAGTDDQTVWVISLPDGFTITRLGGHTDKVVTVAFSPDGKYLATGANDNTANLWRIRLRTEGSLEADRIHQFHHQDWVTSLAFSPDSQTLATGSFDNSAAWWDTATGDLIDVPYRQTQNQVLNLAFSPTGDHFAAGNVRGEVHFWRSVPEVLGPDPSRSQ